MVTCCECKSLWNCSKIKCSNVGTEKKTNKNGKMFRNHGLIGKMRREWGLLANSSLPVSVIDCPTCSGYWDAVFNLCLCLWEGEISLIYVYMLKNSTLSFRPDSRKKPFYLLAWWNTEKGYFGSVWRMLHWKNPGSCWTDIFCVYCMLPQSRGVVWVIPEGFSISLSLYLLSSVLARVVKSYLFDSCGFYLP